MNRRISVTLLATLSLCLIITIAYSIADKKVTVKPVHASTWQIQHKNLEELESARDVGLIIEGTVTNNTNPRKIESQNSPVKYTAMLTEIKIDKIIKSDGKVVDQSKPLLILEPTYIEDNGLMPGKTEYPMFNYYKASPGNKYIFYLSWDEKQQAYWVYAGSQGRYNIDGKDQREKEIETTQENYRNLKISVLEKYRLTK
ncbi:hypothetical protein FE784_18450 [Paenibacillus hemerocallicola]|uniref:Uncharacterized protein n=1 Tax=Paenibacillus hemerocallicola TaxID=1172614 RepID=A0A5C4T717_9BACL|nr:hypothetical protein [Paenibacillus hemerocallicola]TNJ64828.1 hypothetical protein FE784_18450 [Paenibacillus hemerocallicola]